MDGRPELGFTAAYVIDLGRIDAKALIGVLDTFTLVGCGMAAEPDELAFSPLTENGHDMTVITCNTGADSFEMKVSLIEQARAEHHGGDQRQLHHARGHHPGVRSWRARR